MGACQQMMLAQKIAGGGGGASYLIEEDFDGGALPGGWATSGTPDWGYATAPAPLGGYSSSLLLNASGDTITSPAFTDSDEVWVYGLVHQTAISNNGLAVYFANAANTNIGNANVMATGIIRTNAGGSNANTGAGVFAEDTTYHIWIRYVKGTGSNATVDVWISTDGTYTIGSPSGNVTGGSSTDQCAIVKVNCQATTTCIWNKFRVSNAMIGNNPA